MPFGFVRRPCHMPYICRRVNDFESQRGPFRALFSPFRPFHHGVFEALRNILFVGWFAPSSIEHERTSGRKKGLCLRVPHLNDDRNGTLHQRHHDHEHLFIHQLQDIYYAEKQLVKALPKMEESRVDLRVAS
jgi:hypothetical protein